MPSQHGGGQTFCFAAKDQHVPLLQWSPSIGTLRGFGIEPCAYVLGSDAVDVAKKMLKIINGLNYEK